MIVGLDIGTNYTKVTADGKNVIVYPSLVAFGEEKEWSLKGETKSVYVGDEALSIIQSMENIEVLRPLHEGRVLHESYIELAKYGISKLGAEPKVIATGLPVKSSKKEREEVRSRLSSELGCELLIFPQPVGTMAYIGAHTGVCVDIGFGTTDIVVLADMEYLKGETLLMGVDGLFESLETIVRNKIGISLGPEEMTSLLVEGKSVGRIRSGKKIVVSREDIAAEYESLVKSWVERIANRVKLVLEGLSTTLVENFVLAGGGSLLPQVYELFSESFSDIGEITRPEDPIRSNAIGFYKLAKLVKGEPEEREEKAEERRKKRK